MPLQAEYQFVISTILFNFLSQKSLPTKTEYLKRNRWKSRYNVPPIMYHTSALSRLMLSSLAFAVTNSMLSSLSSALALSTA